MKTAQFSGKVFIWPGDLGWHFVYLPKILAKKIKEKKKSHGAGFIKIEAKIGKTSWQTALFPYKREETYLLAIKKAIRGKEGIFVGDEINVKLKFI